MGWFEWLSGSDTPEGARNASLVERIERSRYLADHPPVKSDGSFEWEGCLLTGYHFRKVKDKKPTEYIKWPE
ncbi:MAG: hypothetical protein JO115_12170 [Pseudonocardiales bacterium]|nr:hypothetical protein [Pseudonocardiales bacterium]